MKSSVQITTKMDGMTTEVKVVNEIEFHNGISNWNEFCVGNSSTSVVEEAYETKSKKKFTTRWYARCEQLPEWNMTWK